MPGDQYETLYTTLGITYGVKLQEEACNTTKSQLYSYGDKNKLTQTHACLI